MFAFLLSLLSPLLKFIKPLTGPFMKMFGAVSKMFFGFLTKILSFIFPSSLLAMIGAGVLQAYLFIKKPMVLLTIVLIVTLVFVYFKYNIPKHMKGKDDKKSKKISSDIYTSAQVFSIRDDANLVDVGEGLDAQFPEISL